MEDDKTYLTVAEAAELIRVHPETLRRYVREKKVSPSMRVGGLKEMLFDKAALLEQFSA